MLQNKECIRCRFYKKAQLTLTNPRDAKACRKLLQFDVKTSCRQVNDLFQLFELYSSRQRHLASDIDAFCSRIACFPTPHLFDAP